MTVRTYDGNTPKGYRKFHMAFRLKYFIDNMVLPLFFNHDIKADDVTMGVINKEKMVLRYQGNDLGIIATSGSDFIFTTK
jgi:hypothetical protein